MIHFALVYALESVGQALAVILLVTQVAGAGGTYPVEVLPAVFQKLYPFMPFRYAMDAMRECVAGAYGNAYWRCIGLLLLFALAAAVLGAFVLYSGRDSELKKAVAGREREMLLDYPEIVSKLSLLISAGLTLRAAFEKTASDRGADPEEGLSFAKREMMITVHLMKSGMSEYEAYLDFGKRCAVKRYKKLGALLSQNVRKGSAGLIAEMEREARDAFEERKASARRAGEEASTKLLLPMAMMLSVVMIVVIVPAFLSFSL
jgi:hypothetical protein